MADTNFETFSHIASLSGSAIALASTTYFWLIKVNRERPAMVVEPVGSVEGSVLVPRAHTESYQAIRPREDQVLVGYWLNLAVVNNSVLPNAIIDISAKVRLNDEGWVSARTNLFSNNPETPAESLPINVAPLSTARVPLALSLAMRGDDSGLGNQERTDMATAALAEGNSIEITIKGVRNTSFRSLLNHTPGGKLASQKPLRFLEGYRRAA